MANWTLKEIILVVCLSPFIFCYYIILEILKLFETIFHRPPPPPAPAERPQVHIGNEVIADGRTPYEDAMPCGKCREITLENLVADNGFMHYSNYESLESSAKSGCRLCAIILLAIEKGVAHQPSSAFNSFRNIYNRDDFVFLEADNNCFGNFNGSSLLLSSNLVKIGIGNKVSHAITPLTVISVYIDDGPIMSDPSPSMRDVPPIRGGFVPTLRMYREFRTPEAKSGLIDWIQRTIENDAPSVNKQGTVARPTCLPKRLLCVSRDSPSSAFETRLVEDISEIPSQQAYICLSHCWGSQQHYRLTAETIGSLKSGIEISKLAKNFQDVIELAQLLRIKYVWIDALCILQDSKSDWEIESAKMGQYYKDAWLTVSAGMSNDGMMGLFSKRDAHGLPLIWLRPTRIPKKRYSLFFGLDPVKPSPQCPIRTRGWTLQEEILSSRYISFESTQVYLRCGSVLNHECGRQEDLSKDQSPFMDGESMLQGKGWLEIVMRYSSRNLTQESDKLPALSGLAHEYQARWNDEYLAGIWRQDIWRGLLWRRNESYTIPEPKRPAVYRAPTWSWASIDGRIEFDDGNLGVPSTTTLDDVAVQLASSDPMGQVSGGSIRLTAILVKMDQYGNIPNNLEVRLRKVYDVPDEIRQDSQRREQWLLWITWSSGLIIRPVLNSVMQKYERVGYFSKLTDITIKRDLAARKSSMFPIHMPTATISLI